jgi:hypothetical protein
MPDSELPSRPAARSPFARCAKILFLALLLAWLFLVFWNSAKPLPPGTHVLSQTSRLSESDVELAHGAPDAPAIEHAEQLIVLDRSPVPRELARRLLARKHARPNIKIVLLTDPGNEAFGGTASAILAELEQAGVIVARVRLDRLRDSNPLYSGLWRLLFEWWNDPFDETPGRPTLPAWARMQNFKADQRQLLIADDGSGGWTAAVAATAADPGLTVRGSLARAMIVSELQIAAWSTDDDRLPAAPPSGGRGVGSIDARFLTEGAIESALIEAIAAAGGGDQVYIAVENFSDRRLVAAVLQAAARGVRLQVLMARNRMPNQVVAQELERGAGGNIEVRWRTPAQAAAAPKLLLVRHRNDLWMNWGSANFTRRNLADLNLEAAVELRMPARAAAARAVSDYFTKAWSSAQADAQTGAETADHSAAFYWKYRLAEAAGLSGF